MRDLYGAPNRFFIQIIMFTKITEIDSAQIDSVDSIVLNYSSVFGLKEIQNQKRLACFQS